MLTRYLQKSYNMPKSTKGVAFLDEVEVKPEETQTEEQHAEPKRRKRHKKRAVGGVKLLALIISVLAMLAFCVVMASPLGSCTMTEADYIGKAAAQKIAFSDARVSADSAKNVSVDMIKLDDGMCYKIDFSDDNADYSYILSADSGKIVVSRSDEHPSSK